MKILKQKGMNEFEELLSSLGVDLNTDFSVNIKPMEKIDHPVDPIKVMPKSVKEILTDFEPEATKENPLDAVAPEQEEESKEQPEEESREGEVEVNTLDDNTINDVLSDFGFVDADSQPEMTEMERDIIESYNEGQEENSHEDDNDADEWDDGEGYDDNQGEDYDIVIEQEETGELQSTSQERLEAAMQFLDEGIVAGTPTAPIDSTQIPLNSPTLLIDDSTSRFSGAEWYNEIRRKRIILAGLGGIGSWTALQLGRLIPASMVLYDDDRVERVNMSGQLFGLDDIGKAKVDAVADMISEYTSMHNVYALNERFTRNSEAGDIMICGFDNMEARKTFFLAWNHHVMEKPEEERKNCLFLDGRLSLTDLQVFCIKGDDTYNKQRYSNKYLFKDSEAEATVCSMKQTTYMACMIGSIVVNLFVNFVAESLNPILPYDLPFLTQYDSQNMIFKTEN